MRAINRWRAFRAFEAVLFAVNLVMFTIDAAVGRSYAFIIPGLLLTAAAICFQTVLIRKLERQEGRRGSLTVALLRAVTGRRLHDDVRIAELERECGIGLAPRQGAGTLAVAVHPDGVAFAPSEHFAQLAKVGRKSCVSWCPICADRWLEQERWTGGDGDEHLSNIRWTARGE